MTQVIPAQLMSVQSLSNTILVSSANESTNGQFVKIPKQSGQQMSTNQPIKNGSGQTFFWNMCLPEGSVINTANSYLSYKMKFVFNCKSTAFATGTDDTVLLQQSVITDPESTTAVQTLPAGRYTILDNGLWCEPAMVNNSGKFNTFGKPQYMCQFPMNSSNIINQTTIQYGNVTHTDDMVFFQRPIIQAHLSEEYQAMFKTQFFDQNIDPIMKFIVSDDTGNVNGFWTANTYNVPYQITKYKTFTIGLNMVNQLFDIKNKFYTAAYTRQTVQLSIKLQPYSMSKLFFTEDITDAQSTGIVELDLNCYVKQSTVLPSELATKGEFAQTYHKYTMDTLTLAGGIMDASTTYLSSGHDSTNDVILCLSLPDTNNKDSTYLKQRYTLFNSTQISKIMNGLFNDDTFVFFHNLNLERGSAAYRYFSEDLINPVLMTHETLRSMGALTQYDTSVSPAFNTIMKQMTKYGMVRINLEAFSMESAQDADVKYDGYHSVIQRVLIKTAFAIYNPNDDTIQKYTSQNAIAKGVEITGDLINLFAFQTFDQIVKMNPATGAMSIQENIK